MFKKIINYITGKKNSEISAYLSLHSELSENNIKIDDRFITIKDIQFYGRYVKSKNGKFILGYNQGNSLENFIDGGIALVEDNNFLFFEDIKRPIRADVSNNGNFVILSNPSPLINSINVLVYNSKKDKN